MIAKVKIKFGLRYQCAKESMINFRDWPDLISIKFIITDSLAECYRRTQANIKYFSIAPASEIILHPGRREISIGPGAVVDLFPQPHVKASAIVCR